MNKSKEIIIFDTTLRDGEQAPGCSMTLGEKLKIAHALKELNVNVIEAGFAAASPGDFESIKAPDGKTLSEPTFIIKYFFLKIFVKPLIIGNFLINGSCPPSNPNLTLPPDREF